MKDYNILQTEILIYQSRLIQMNQSSLTLSKQQLDWELVKLPKVAM